MTKEKLVLYRDPDGYKVTPESNYHAMIRNARQVTDCSGFANPDEIIRYYCRWFRCSADDFIVKF